MARRFDRWGLIIDDTLVLGVMIIFDRGLNASVSKRTQFSIS